MMRAGPITRLARLIRFDRGDDSAARTLRRRLDVARAAAHKWKARHDADRREIPSVALLREVFAHRLRTLPARAGAAAAREERFVGVSKSYGAELDAGVTRLPSGAEPATIDGVTWWVPRGAGADRLPYHGILQTREVSTGGIMLDLGANIGRMAIPRVVLGDVTAAYCAEPDPLNFSCLVRTVIDNGLRGLVLPDQTAIGDRNGTVSLLREGTSGNFRVVTDSGGATGNTVEVPCCTLDGWVERLGIDLDAVTFIKIDVEGFERRVIAGATRVLASRHIAWQMEIKPKGLRVAGDEPAALYADLRRAFTHFIDLNRRAAGARVRPAGELGDALTYIEPDGKTDVLLFSASEALA